jgi:phage portal protein BeeE
MPSNLRDAINRSPNAADLSALGANDTYSRRVNEELALRADASAKADALAAKNEDLLSVVTLFSNAVAATRAVMTRFTEASPYIQEALKQIQLAMGVISDNPVPAPAPAGTAHSLFGKPGAAPSPSPSPAPAPSKLNFSRGGRS